MIWCRVMHVNYQLKASQSQSQGAEIKHACDMYVHMQL